VGNPQVSPDGRQIIYTRRWVDKMNDRWESSLWIMNADGGRNRFLADGSSARWSPDGTRIAFLREGEPRGTQIFVRWMDAEGATSRSRGSRTLGPGLVAGRQLDRVHGVDDRPTSARQPAHRPTAPSVADPRS
jgi:dipeptidyl aminopeptidase/acylaminoacyl peptidase